MVEILCLPYRIVVSDVFAYLEIVSKVVDNLNHQIPQFMFSVYFAGFSKNPTCAPNAATVFSLTGAGAAASIFLMTLAVL